MFKVGDEVTVNQNYPITKMGDIGTIISIPYAGVFRVKFHTIGRKDFVGHEFDFNEKSICLWHEEHLTPVERKIRRMYERQPYFLRHRSGQFAS